MFQVIKMTSLKIYISPSIKTLETLKFRQQVNHIQKVALGNHPRDVVTSLPHKYVTFANVRGKNNSLIEVHRALLHYG